VCVTCGLAGLLALAKGPRTAQGDDAKWTLSMQLSTRNGHAMAGLVRAFERSRSRVAVTATPQTLRIAGSSGGDRFDWRTSSARSMIRQAAVCRSGTVYARRPADIARLLDEVSDHNRGWPDGLRISKIIPDEVSHRLIVVADEAGFSASTDAVRRTFMRLAPAVIV
jgi:hypothetical protein